MGLLSRVGAAMGIGAADVSVTTEKPRYVWGETVRGTVNVQGGKVDQTATEIIARVTEHWTTEDSEGDTTHHYRHYSDAILATEVAIPAGASQTLMYAVTIPDQADLSNDWSVSARVCVPRAADRAGEVGFMLMPNRPVLGLVTALMAVAPFEPFSVYGRGDEVTVDFHPPAESAKELDGVKLTVRTAEGKVTGTLEINPQEKSLADRMKAMVGKDRVRHPLSFPAEDLAAGADGNAPEAVVSALRGLLGSYLK